MHGSPDWHYVFSDLGDVGTVPLALVEGTIPPDLRGSFLTNGAGWLHAGSEELHVFDGHGRVSATTFDEQGVSFCARLVETPLLLAEKAAGSVVKRRLFTSRAKRWANFLAVDLGNNALHNVITWGEHLVALQDPGWFLLDRQSLATLGPAPRAGFGPSGVNLSPMPRVDPASGHLITFFQRPGRKDKISIVHYDQAWQVVHRLDHQLSRGGLFFHDIVATEHFYVLVQWGQLALGKFLWGARPVADAVTFHPQKTPHALLIAKDGSSVHEIALPGYLQFHIVNAFEVDDVLTLRTIGYDRKLDFSALYPETMRTRLGVALTPSPLPTPLEHRITWRDGQVRSRVLPNVIGETPEINGAYHGRPQRFAWLCARTVRGDEVDEGAYPWFHGLAKVDYESGEVDVFDAGPRRFTSPPAFVPRVGDGLDEDDGYILMWIHDATKNAAELGVFSAQRPSAGPIARLAYAGVLGMVSHSHFATPLA